MNKGPPGLLKQLLGWLRKRGWALPLLRPSEAIPDLDPLPAAEDAGELAVSRARDAEIKAIDKEFIQAEFKDIAKSLRNM